MIRHCVFIRFRPEITPAERERLFEAITDLMPLVPGMLADSIVRPRSRVTKVARVATAAHERSRPEKNPPCCRSMTSLFDV